MQPTVKDYPGKELDEKIADAVYAGENPLDVIRDSGGDDKPIKTRRVNWWIVPLSLFSPVVEVFTQAGAKYRRLSFMDGSPEEVGARYWPAVFSHLEAVQEGEWFDKESKLPHLAHVASNILILLWWGTRHQICRKFKP